MLVPPRFLAGFLAFAAFLMGQACKTASDGSFLQRAAFEDVGPSKTQTWTEARVLSFNRWASELLTAKADVDDFQVMADQYFARLGIDDAEKLDRYAVSVRPGSECFWEGQGGHQIWWNANRDQIRRQVESAAQFVFDFHKAMLGRPRGPFAIREVEICPQSVVGRKLFLVGQKLVIGVPYTTLGNYQPISSDQILKAWHDGEHLGDEQSLFSQMFTASKLKQVWKLFDPIGVVRTNLRVMLHESGVSLSRRIAALVKAYGVDMRVDATTGEVQVSGAVAAGKQELLSQDILRSLERFLNTPLLSNEPVASIQQLAAEGRLLDMLKNWACEAGRVQLADDLSHGVLSTFDEVMRRDSSKVNVAISAGLVAVGNYHRIGVSFAAAGGAFNDYVGKPSTEARGLDINAEVSGGLVAVFTVDDIKVDAAVRLMTDMAKKSLESASFDAAVRAAQQHQSLCGV